MASTRVRHLRDRARGLVSRARHRTAGRPVTVSVVVTARMSHAPFLDECLDSLFTQSWPHVDVIVAPYGPSPDPVVQLVEARKRATLVEASATVGAARNRGARAATGNYLVFVAAGDIVPRSALARMCESLESSGSDFARGEVVVGRPRPGQDRSRGSAALPPVTGASLGQAPEVMASNFVEGTTFRRSFWSGSELAFADSDGPALDLAVARSHLVASSFDVLAGPTYRYMDRGTGQVIGAEKDALADLDEWLDTWDQITAMLAQSDEAVRHAWLTGLMRSSLVRLLAGTEQADAVQWERLRATVVGMIGLGGPGLLAMVPVVPRLHVWLAAMGRRDDLEDFVADRRLEKDDFCTRVESGVVSAEMPLRHDPDMPSDLFELSPTETPLSASLRRLRWRSDDVVELDVFAVIRHLTMTEAPEVSVRLADPVSGRRLDLAVQQRQDLEVNRFAALRWQDVSAGAFTVEVDAVKLVEIQVQEWVLEIELTASGVTRSGVVGHRLHTGSAGLAGPRSVGTRVVSLPPGPGPVTVAVSPPRSRLLAATIEGRTIVGSVLLGPNHEHRSGEVQVSISQGRAQVTATRVEAGAKGELHFEVSVPERPEARIPFPERHWALNLLTEVGPEPVAWLDSSAADWRGQGPTSVVALHRTSRGDAEVLTTQGLAEIEGVELSRDALTVRGSWVGTPVRAWTLALSSDRLTVRGEPATGGEDGRFEVRLPLTYDEWGLDEVGLPRSTYRIVMRAHGDRADEEGEDLPLMIHPALVQELPVDQSNDRFRVRIGRGAAGRLLIFVQKPYAEDELGPFAQQTLRSAYRASMPVLDPDAVYLQSYTGVSATDSPLAIHHELRRTHPHLTLYWGVADSSTTVPEGGVPVMTYTREWYEVLARATYLVNNVDFDRWFARKPGQRLLQTFHGYPAKSMGIGMWRSKNYGPRRIRAELDRTSRHWDLILTPTPEMDVHYRTEYAYDGPILSHGYPRDDVLVGDRGASARRRTRELLGIVRHQTVVLYAPTWRDDLATSYRSSPLVRHLDLSALGEALGEDFVLLMRGHRFHDGQPRSAGEARLIDVTHYPEINDLILAADVAVLDYSSIRFDFALTGRPMLFLVPDIERYAGDARGFLFPFEESAPGPLVATADELLVHLQDLDRVRENHRAAYEAFNERFNYLQDGRSAERVVATFFDPPTEQ